MIGGVVGAGAPGLYLWRLLSPAYDAACFYLSNFRLARIYFLWKGYKKIPVDKLSVGRYNREIMKVLNDELVYNGQFLQVINRHFIDREGKKAVWEMVKRKTQGDIIGIVAVTKDKEIILEKIFRVPLNDYVLELPAGLMDIKGESEEAMVRRELLEETGYAVESVEELMRGPFSAGLRDGEMAIYLGMNAYFVQEPMREGAEDIEVVKVSLNRLFDYLMAQKGKLKVDLKMASVIPYLERKGLL